MACLCCTEFLSLRAPRLAAPRRAWRLERLLGGSEWPVLLRCAALRGELAQLRHGNYL